MPEITSAEITQEIRSCSVRVHLVGATYEEAERGGPYLAVDPRSLKETSSNAPLCNWNALHGELAMRAVRATGGSVTEVTDLDLISASRSLDKIEIYATRSGAAGLAGLSLNGGNSN